MNLIQKIKSAGKKALASTAMAGALFCTQAQAQDNVEPRMPAIGAAVADQPASNAKSALPARTLSIPIGDSISEGLSNPLDGFDTNTQAWYSTTQLLGKGSDLLGIKAGLDDYLLGRLAQVAFLSYLNHATSYYFHEMAHDYEDRKLGLQKYSPPGIDFSDWSKGVPAYKQTGGSFDPIFREEHYVRSWTNGLNQEEFQAGFLYKEQNVERRIAFDEAISFLSAKTADIVYIAVANQLVGLSVNEDVDYKSIEHVALPGDDVYPTPSTLRNQGLWNDIDAYLHHLHRQGVYELYRKYPTYILPGPPPTTVVPIPPGAWDPRRKGIELTRKQLLTQFIVADALSLRTWESLYAIANYVVTGERSSKPITVKLGKTEITPPLITHYLTPRGSFYNSNALVNIAGKYPFEVNFGTDIDTVLGPGDVSRVRTGAQLNWSHESLDEDGKRGAIWLRPFVYFNFDRHARKYVGYSAGAELAFGIPDAFELTVKAEQNEHDLVENTVKGKEKGLTVSTGVKIKY